MLYSLRDGHLLEGAPLLRWQLPTGQNCHPILLGGCRFALSTDRDQVRPQSDRLVPTAGRETGKPQRPALSAKAGTLSLTLAKCHHPSDIFGSDGSVATHRSTQVSRLISYSTRSTPNGSPLANDADVSLGKRSATL